MALKLIIRMKQSDMDSLKNGGEYLSKDESKYVPCIKAYYAEQGAPYSDCFVSLAILDDTPNYKSDSKQKATYQEQLTTLYGYGCVIAELKQDTVLPELVLLAAGDIQNAAVNRYKDSVHLCSSMSNDDRLRACSAALEICKQSGRRYAEARLNRPLIFNDIEAFDLQDCSVLDE